MATNGNNGKLKWIVGLIVGLVLWSTFVIYISGIKSERIEQNHHHLKVLSERFDEYSKENLETHKEIMQTLTIAAADIE